MVKAISCPARTRACGDILEHFDVRSACERLRAISGRRETASGRRPDPDHHRPGIRVRRRQPRIIGAAARRDNHSPPRDKPRCNRAYGVQASLPRARLFQIARWNWSPPRYRVEACRRFGEKAARSCSAGQISPADIPPELALPRCDPELDPLQRLFEVGVAGLLRTIVATFPAR